MQMRTQGHDVNMSHLCAWCLLQEQEHNRLIKYIKGSTWRVRSNSSSRGR